MTQDQHQYARLWLDTAQYAADLARKYGLDDVTKQGRERVAGQLAECCLTEREAGRKVFGRLLG